MTTPASAPAPNDSCLLPPSLTGPTVAEDFATTFEAVCMLPNWVAPILAPRRHSFSACLTGDALTFNQSLTTAQKCSYD